MEILELSQGSVVVTGGLGGIGVAIVEELAASARHVVAFDLDAQAQHDQPNNVTFVQGDAGSLDDCARAVGEAESVAPLVGWVNNAAVFRDAQLLADGIEDFLSAVTAHLRLAVTGTAAAVRAFEESGVAGSIVNVSSHQSTRPVRGAAAYATAKGAIDAFTRAMSVDLGPAGVRVNSVAPGSIMTARQQQLLEQLSPGERMANTSLISEVHALQRIGQPHEVARAVRFLLSQDAGFVTGAVLPVDGGRSVLGIDPEAR